MSVDTLGLSKAEEKKKKEKKIVRYEVHFGYSTYSDSLGPITKVNSV